MLKLKMTSAFKKSYKRCQKRGMEMNLLDEIIDKLRREERLDEKFKDHALTGNFIGFRECHIKPDWLLIYHVSKDVLTLTAVDTGTHSDLFNI